ncbi:protein of unknown function (DUF1230) [Rubidibacter lacunae KORDI 51-2]|uniref:Uncharacterized protein n=1 Tax=Rubidibacter lacunae KORDI 51-2 TaxID=582515 RepID=U5DL50_9CHRO|nr:CGLD27 family protein [Rubidibacter lacunae]ERN42416.1 protein of unknown function (DUF1230) [Rubidibacter lacunae KORDI 51-2]
MEPLPTTNCPVPCEQQPLQEYEQMRGAWLFCWATLEGSAYWRKLGWVWAWGWVAAGPIAATSFAPNSNPLHFTLCASGGAAAFVLLLLLRLYTGWSYIDNRLSCQSVSYEESGWYDGQTWEKPPEVLVRDRLVADYQVRPLLKRLRATLAVLLSIAAIAGAAWVLVPLP